MDSICHLMCTNEFNSTTITIPSPFDQNEFIDLSVQENGRTDINVSLVNGSPYIKIKIPLVASIKSMEFGLDLNSNENISILESYTVSYLKDKILSYLYKTSKDYHADIAGFGESLTSKYLTMQDWENENWLRLYIDSTFDVDVSVDIKNSYILIGN